MRLPLRLLASLFPFAAAFAGAPSAPVLPAVQAALTAQVEAGEIAGAVTLVVTRDAILHHAATGLADRAASRPMREDTVFWIASMTKPLTGAAILLLQDEGKLRLEDPVAKHLPEFAALRTPAGRPANLTIAQVLTHTSGLAEAPGPAAEAARTLADLVPAWLAAPMQYEPGARWKYTQSGINVAGRIVERISGLSFDEFLARRLFGPLGMKDTTFFPEGDIRARLVTAYEKHRQTGELRPVPPRAGYEGGRNRPPLPNGGLYSTGRDYARFCQLLLGEGVFEGRRILSVAAVQALRTPLTGDLPTGFFQSEAHGQYGRNYAWGPGTCILQQPHPGLAAMLSPGTFGHGGAWGTQAWIDPVKGVAYILMVQRSNFPNSDASVVRLAFQQAAAAR